MAVEWSGSTTAPAPATGRARTFRDHRVHHARYLSTTCTSRVGPAAEVTGMAPALPEGSRWRAVRPLERRSIERIAQAKRPMAAAHAVRSHSRFRPERPHLNNVGEDNATRPARTIPSRRSAVHGHAGTKDPRRSGGAEKRSLAEFASPRPSRITLKSGRHLMSPDRPGAEGGMGVGIGVLMMTVRRRGVGKEQPGAREPAPYTRRRFRCEAGDSGMGGSSVHGRKFSPGLSIYAVPRKLSTDGCSRLLQLHRTPGRT